MLQLTSTQFTNSSIRFEPVKNCSLSFLHKTVAVVWSCNVIYFLIIQSRFRLFFIFAQLGIANDRREKDKYIHLKQWSEPEKN